MEELDGLLTETETLFHDAQEEGLLTSSRFVEQTRESLANFHNNAITIRAQVHSATSLSAQCLEMLKGLSQKISTISKQVKTVRAKISTTSASEKERLRRSALTVERVEALPEPMTTTDETLAGDDGEPDRSDLTSLPDFCLDRMQTTDTGSSDDNTINVVDDDYVKAEAISPIENSQQTSPLPTA
ncbi:hypothetical protein EVG20_g7710 [Dentipellis fragilis]|uniref:Uncharacterized protein n=1 Tax=Dentipellis fragilis TaxID=205917 RepID=A0A4Y9YBV7_9AGAM|nr:hypothetical protein EVG20_g7710 [Dentipellis fragilis]